MAGNERLPWEKQLGKMMQINGKMGIECLLQLSDVPKKNMRRWLYMLEVSKKIMEVFRKYQVGRDGTMILSTLHGNVAQWNQGLQDQYHDGIKELTEMGYIKDKRNR